MATCFDRWEKDPFFPAAEEVQESSDRMESIYRRWIHEQKIASNRTSDRESDSHELLNELRLALGTAKWQLEELAREIRSNDEACSPGDDMRARHCQFIAAIANHIAIVENSFRGLNQEQRDCTSAWVTLDQGERDELALFLSNPFPEPEKAPIANRGTECLKIVGLTNEISNLERKEEHLCGHRRTASASAEIGSWKILVSGEDIPRRSVEEQTHGLPVKVPSLSCLAKAVEPTSKMNWCRNGFRKWKTEDHHQPAELIPLKNNQFSRELDACYERTKSCLGDCDDETYNKQLYGWIGALHRQLQRSQYQIQYGRPIQMILCILFLVLLVDDSAADILLRANA
ncbi:hypothetical protein ACMD2_05566 [Ananas comosus]|uniref:Ig-like domain-containing protein n=1 Tax=Ananas comosus TaxID=4615 RepID=A0A199VWZ5_ANACO|nr:hypothetical protein ACMD2_05566 [Ananas comosus]